jgi:hypothetical protein
MAQKDPQKPVDRDVLASEALLREASEELRREQVENIWKRYGGILLVICLLIVAATAVNEIYKAYSDRVNTERTDALYAWLELPDGKSRIEALGDPITAPETSQQWIQLFYAANDALTENDFDKARALYAKLREKRNLGGDLRWLADLMALRVDTQIGDQDAAVLQSRLEELGNQANNPWRAFAFYDAAIIAGEANNNPEDARNLLAKALQHGAGSVPFTSMIRDMQLLYGSEIDTQAQNTATDDMNETDAPEAQIAE